MSINEAASLNPDPQNNLGEPTANWRGLPLQWQQKQAADAALQRFQSDDRLQVIMACGSGKTLVAANVAVERQSERVIVLVPSLALMRQTLISWQENGALEQHRVLCVCSDASTAEADDVSITNDDLPIPVTTNPLVIQLELSRPGKLIVFCTYQSSGLLARAAPDDHAFGLGVFDEAHRTATKVAGQFTIALHDDRIKMDKRLFMTATPKHYSVTAVDMDGERKAVFSMNNRAVYGSVAYSLGFREAIDTGVICDYRVVVSAVTGEQIDGEFRRLGLVRDSKGEYRAAMLANQVSLAKSFESLKTRRAITFHRSVKEAKEFAMDENHILSAQGVSLFHVNGAMPASRRQEIINEFDSCNGPAVLTNARCLTEGVDLPAVDMVGFMSAKGSELDIAQAVGRALRRANNKSMGYVMLPLYVGDTTSDTAIEEAVKREGYAPIWDVLATMQEQDAQFGNALTQGRIARADPDINTNVKLESLIVLSGGGFVEQLRRTIETIAVTKLTSSWEENFAATVNYKKANNGADPPQGRVVNGRDLGIWCNRQRILKKNGMLAHDKFTRLSSIGLKWEIRKEHFEEMFDNLLSYKRAHGHVKVAVDEVWDGRQLGEWCAGLRNANRRGKVLLERIDRLNEVGFIWQKEDGYDRFFNHLQRLHAEHGSVDSASKSDWHMMPQWFRKIRNAKQNGLLSTKQIEQLEGLGFRWSLPDQNEQRIEQLERYRELHGHCRVGFADSDPTFAGLHSWVSKQRMLHKRGRLTPERYNRLSALGMNWDLFAENWEEGMSHLLAYKATHGSVLVTKGYVCGDGFPLGKWFRSQHSAWRLDRLPPHKIKDLTDAGVSVQKVSDVRWELRFSELRDQFAASNTTVVSTTDRLYAWVSAQRGYFADGTLSLEKRERLEAIGLNLTIHQDRRAEAESRKQEAQLRQEQKAQQVAQAKTEKKNAEDAKWRQDYAAIFSEVSNVSVHQRGGWLRAQRTSYKAGRLEAWQVELLDKAGIPLDRKMTSGCIDFNKRLDRLKQLVSISGSFANVMSDQSCPEEIRKWVKALRVDRKTRALDESMIKALDEIGFAWGPYDTRWEEMFAQVASVYRASGSLEKDALSKSQYQWLIGQRISNRDGKLAEDRVKKLDSIGMDWSTRDKFFERNFEALEGVFNKYQTTTPPGLYRSDDRKCYQMVIHFRNLRRDGKLSDDQIARLDRLNFDWKTSVDDEPKPATPQDEDVSDDYPTPSP